MSMKNAEYILGLHAGHDATAVLMKDGVILEAMSEERLSRQKKHWGYPHLAVAYIKNKYKLDSFAEVVLVGIEPNPGFFATAAENKAGRDNPVKAKYFARAVLSRLPIISTLLTFRDRLLMKKVTNGVMERIKTFMVTEFPGATITYLDHHLAHAWATVPFLPDSKKAYTVLTLDGAGDNLSASVCRYAAGTLTRISATPISASLGLLYSAVVDILGMARNEHEFKVMGLAPYAKASSGEKVYQKLKELIWFDVSSLTFKSAIPLEHATPHLIAHSYYQYRFDSLAYGIQKLTEELMKEMTVAAVTKLGISDVAVGGGVFMNVKANQYLRALPEVSSLTITPSCGDESLAIGAVVARYSELHDGDMSGLKPLNDIYLGSEYSDTEIAKAIENDSFVKTCTVTKFASEGATVEAAVADLLASNNVVGRFAGRAEWGARALGNRSILANASSRENVKLINEMIKGRDFWMPFATSMLYEKRTEYLKDAETYKAPFMAITFETKERAHTELIAALHPYDLTSRPQMVEAVVNPGYHALITHFQAKTGVGGILNTSFNLHGEPNVEKPEDALRTFALSGLRHLAIGHYLISKK